MNFKKWRTPIALAAFVLAFLSLAPAAFAQQWPSRPVRVILPFPAGGSTDTLVRLLSEKLGQRLGQVFIVENKPGGLTLIGTSDVVHAAPDGYTVLLNANGITLLHLTVKTDFDVRRDLLPVTILRSGMLGAFINASLPINNVKELVAYAKANPGKLNYASLGSGSNVRIEFELFEQQAGGGLDIVQVPYKGEAQILPALLSGEVNIFLGSFLVLGPQLSTGKLRLIAVGGNKRSPQFPDVPTYREQGVPFTHGYWSGFFLPAKTPIEIARRLQTELKAIYQLPDIYPVLTRNGEEVGGQQPEEFRQQVLDEAATWEGVIKRIGIVPQ